MHEKLSAAHQRTYESIFAHPLSHNIEWRDIRSLLESLGEVTEEHNGNCRIVRNEGTLVLHPNGSAVDATTLIKIRHFLQSTQTADSSALGDHLLVVIDHREARIFRSELRGSVPEKIVPHDPHGFGKHFHNVHDSSEGQHHPVPKSYFEAVAKSLAGAGKILLFGTGSGGGSAMSELVDELHKEHRDIFDRIIGVEAVDETHLSEGELLAKAREFYAVPHSASLA